MIIFDPNIKMTLQKVSINIARIVNAVYSANNWEICVIWRVFLRPSGVG